MAMKKNITFLVVGLVFLVVGINIFIQQSLRETQDAPVFQQAVTGEKPPAAVAVAAATPAEPTEIRTGEIVRQNRVIPGDDYEESVFLQGGKEIARQKIVRGEVVEQIGQVPSGNVRVQDLYQQTKGEEFYKDGKRQGVARMYYEGGVLRRETTYEDGKILLVKEYFNNGAIHFTEDLRDALDIPNQKELGVGKVYYRNGMLKYEWNLTRSNRRGFKKAYNAAGEVVMETYFDQKGQVVE